MAMSKAMRPLLGLAAAALACVSAAKYTTSNSVLEDTDLRKCHSSFDLDGDKNVSISDMTEYAKKRAKSSAMFMEKVDTNGDGSASLEEYLAIPVVKDVDGKETDKFKAVDTDGDLKLNSEELAFLVYSNALTALHVQADEDGDGHLAYDEMTEDHSLGQFAELCETRQEL